MEVLEKYVKAFKFGKWPNGKEKWVVGQWVWGDNEVQYIFPANFESRDEAMKWIKDMAMMLEPEERKVQNGSA